MTFCADLSHAILPWEGFALCSLWTRKSYTSSACPAYVLQSPVLSLGTAVDTQVGGEQLRAARAVVLLLWASWKSNWPSIRQDINHTFPGVWEYVPLLKQEEGEGCCAHQGLWQAGWEGDATCLADLEGATFHYLFALFVFPALLRLSPYFSHSLLSYLTSFCFVKVYSHTEKKNTWENNGVLHIKLFYFVWNLTEMILMTYVKWNIGFSFFFLF